MAEKHYFEQKEYTREYLIPYLRKYISDLEKLKVLEIGCAEGGTIEEFMSVGIDAVGLEIDENRVEIARKKNPSIKIIVGDITNPDIKKYFLDDSTKKFDLIIMRETIEHIKNKKAAFDNLVFLLNQNGYIFISFPPKYSPFAGHQQIARSFLKLIPYLHLFPNSILKPIAKLLNEKKDYVDEIKLHYSTGCTINKIESLSSYYKLKVIRKDLYLFRPIYTYRYGLPSIKLPDIPLIREFITFGYEVLLRNTSN